MYISRSFKMDVDSVVKYLILIFVSVFDPLAICLVIASTHALETRRNQKLAAVETAAASTVVNTSSVAKPAPQPPPVYAEVAPVEAKAEPEDIIVQMNFKDELEDKKAV